MLCIRRGALFSQEYVEKECIMCPEGVYYTLLCTGGEHYATVCARGVHYAVLCTG